jgi:hypothetical protein
MPVTSRRVQLSNYALVEYIYSDTQISTTKAKPYLLTNGYNGQYQFLNSSASINTTGNVLDRSATPVSIDGSQWVSLSTQSPVPVIQLDKSLKLIDKSADILNEQYYDTVRVHLAAGYDFPGIDGFIIDIQWVEWSSTGSGGKKFTAAAQCYLNSNPIIQYNTNPLFLGDKLYDRYVEFSVPALSSVNADFWNSPNATNTIGYQYTHNNVGFLQSSLIYANLREIISTTTSNENSYFTIGNVHTASFNPADEYSYIGANIIENTTYDFFEYYPTYNGGYIENYLAELNATPGGNWIVINQLNVYEQAGTNMILTSSMTLLQEGNFNESSIIRPVLRNAAYDYSFTIQYTMRLLNKTNNAEIIRVATVSSANPKKYGYSLERINVLEGFTPVKVYNKIEKVQSSALSNSIIDNQGAYGFGTPKIITQSLYVNNYIDVNYVSVDSTTNIGDVLGQTIYPQGLNYIFLTKFVNFVKFKIFTKSADKNQNVNLDLSSSGMNVTLSFIFDDDSKIYIKPLQDLKAANPGAGELLFRIDDITSAKLLKGVNRGYYIINKNAQGDEVLIYAGKFESQDKKTTVMAAVNQTLINDLNTQITKLQTAQNSLLTGASSGMGMTGSATSGNGVTGSASPSSNLIYSSIVQQSSTIESANTFVSASSKGVNNAIQSAASNSSASNPASNLHIPEIPGVTPMLGSPITLALQPKVIKPSDPASGTGTLSQRLTQGSISNIANQQSV